MSQKDYQDTIEKINLKEKKIKAFGDLLNAIKDLDSKKKLLWLDIYNNAVDDRENAAVLFMDTLMQVKGNVANHNILGPVVAKYLERMSKANDQILKLAELIANETTETPVDDNSIYDSIGKFDDMAGR